MYKKMIKDKWKRKFDKRGKEKKKKKGEDGDKDNVEEEKPAFFVNNLYNNLQITFC